MRHLTASHYKNLSERDLRLIAGLIGDNAHKSCYLAQVEDFFELRNASEETIQEALHYAEHCWSNLFE